MKLCTKERCSLRVNVSLRTEPDKPGHWWHQLPQGRLHWKAKASALSNVPLIGFVSQLAFCLRCSSYKWEFEFHKKQWKYKIYSLKCSWEEASGKSMSASYFLFPQALDPPAFPSLILQCAPSSTTSFCSVTFPFCPTHHEVTTVLRLLSNVIFWQVTFNQRKSCHRTVGRKTHSSRVTCIWHFLFTGKLRLTLLLPYPEAVPLFPSPGRDWSACWLWDFLCSRTVIFSVGSSVL